MLEYKPNKRATLEEIEKFKWMKETMPSLEEVQREMEQRRMKFK